MSEKKGVMDWLQAIPGNIKDKMYMSKAIGKYASSMKREYNDKYNTDLTSGFSGPVIAPSWDPSSGIEYNCNSMGEFKIRNSNVGSRVEGIMIDGNLFISDVFGMNENRAKKYEAGQRRQAMPINSKGSYKTILRDLAKA